MMKLAGLGQSYQFKWLKGCWVKLQSKPYPCTLHIHVCTCYKFVTTLTNVAFEALAARLDFPPFFRLGEDTVWAMCRGELPAEEGRRLRILGLSLPLSWCLSLSFRAGMFESVATLDKLLLDKEPSSTERIRGKEWDREKVSREKRKREGERGGGKEREGGKKK